MNNYFSNLVSIQSRFKNSYFAKLILLDDGDCYGWKPSKKEAFEWHSYSQVKERAEHVGSALIELGFKPATETFIGIFAKNRVEVFHRFLLLESVPIKLMIKIFYFSGA